MLTAEDLYRLEIRVRVHAEALRREAKAFDASEGTGLRAHARGLRIEADEFDMVGNLLVGLQGNWTVLGPLVRQSYSEVMAEFEKRKAAKDEAA